MRKRILFFSAFLLILLTLSSLTSAQDQTVFGPKDLTIRWWPIHLSFHRFTVDDPGDGLITITKNTPGKKIRGGFLFLNRTFIPLRSFLFGNDTGFERHISLRHRNRLMVFLRGRPGTSITIAVRRKAPVPRPEVSFSAHPAAIKLNESATLTWSTTNAESVSIDQGIGSVDLNGSHDVRPTKTTAYTLTAMGPGGTTTKSVTVTVHQPPTVSISTDPEAILFGESATLSWSSTNATAATIDQGIGDVPVEGSTTVSPTKTTTYTITATGFGGTATDSVKLPLIAPPEDVDHGIPDDDQQGGAGLVGETICILNGAHVEWRSDLSFPSPHSLGLTFEASYNSRSQSVGTLGYSWTHTYDISLDPAYQREGREFLKIIDEKNRAHYFLKQNPSLYRGVFQEPSQVTREAGVYVWYRLDGTRYGFSSSGELIWIDDEKENRLELAYDGGGLLHTVTDTATGRVLTLSYNADGLLQFIQGPVTPSVPDGIWVRYGYDDTDNLTSVTYADGSGFTYAYTDPTDIHKLTEKRDKLNHWLKTWSYDDEDRATSTFSV